MKGKFRVDDRPIQMSDNVKVWLAEIGDDFTSTPIVTRDPDELQNFKSPLTRLNNYFPDLSHFRDFCLFVLIRDGTIQKDTSDIRIEFALSKIEEFSESWYALKILHLSGRLPDDYFSNQEDVSTKNLPVQSLDDFFAIIDYALMIGALYREMQISTRHRKNALRGKIDAEQRRLGGKTRAHPQRAKIIAGIQRRIDEGQTTAQAARATYEVDRLGSSPRANASLWRRVQQKKSDRS